jgi:hypothetical protein
MCCKNYHLIFSKVQISKKFKKIILKFFVICGVLARCKGHSSYEANMKQTIIVESNWECANVLFVSSALSSNAFL